jgi:D-aminopeptidase
MRNAEVGARNNKVSSRIEMSLFRLPRSTFHVLSLLIVAFPLSAQRPRARDLGLTIGMFPPGPLNAITDVAGVRVGHTTLSRGDSINTGVTAILPHGGNPFREKVPAAIVVGNGFGKLAGSTQVNELGELESPIVLTCTLCVPRAADAVLTWLLGLPGNEDVRSANPVVGETNDGFLNNIRARPITEADVLGAIRGATAGAVAEGAVGAGRGTVAFGYKGGIGTASRVLPERLGAWTLGVLVQSNYGGDLRIDGVPVGRELARAHPRNGVGAQHAAPLHTSGDGSIIIVVATDAPLDHRQLTRVARRALTGLARTGSSMSSGSGDYVIAFSTVRPPSRPPAVAEEALSPLFQAVIEATEEAIYNSLLRAESVRGYRGEVRALPIDSTLTILKRHGAVRP